MTIHTVTMRKALFLLTLVLLLSCQTIRPGISGPETRAATPEALVPRWTPFAAELTPGLSFFAGRVANPRLELWALRVDLNEPGLRIVVNGGPPPGDGEADAPPSGWTPEYQPGHMPSTTISGFVKRYRCLAGINANPFSPVSGWEGQDRYIDGIAVAGGYVAALPNPAFDALVFYDDSERQAGSVRAAIVSQADIAGEALETIQHAVGGFRIVLRQGVLPERLLNPEEKPPRHPRSAAGISADGKTLYLLAVDGRRLGSIGATEAELGILLRQLGAVWGLNFDGGGSTALVLRDSRGKVKAVNIPIHHQIPGWERGVAACLGIALAPVP